LIRNVAWPANLKDTGQRLLTT